MFNLDEYYIHVVLPIVNIVIAKIIRINRSSSHIGTLK
jgi:hypothetical protein